MRSELSADVVEEIYRGILAPSFAPDELDPLPTLLRGLAEGGAARGLCAFDGETPAGCIVGYSYPRARVLLIGYLAVRPGLRGGGIGHALMDAAERRWYGQPDAALVLAEVEDPRRHPVIGDSDPKRRAAFYARRGAQVVLGPYFQPRLDRGKKRVHGLFLTVLNAGGGALTPENWVSAAHLTEFILEYFRDSGEGGDFPRADDAEGQRLLAWYRDRETVPLHPIGDYAGIEIPALGEQSKHFRGQIGTEGGRRWSATRRGSAC